MCELLDFLALVTMCTAAIYFGLVGPIWAGLAASGRIGITEVRYYSCQYGLRPSDTLCVARVQISLLANFFLLLLLLLCHKKSTFLQMHVLVALHNIWLGCVLILLSELVRCVERSSRIDDNNNNREPVVRNIGGNNGIGNDDDDGDYNE